MGLLTLRSRSPVKPCSECGTPTDRAYVYDPDIAPIYVCEDEDCQMRHTVRILRPEIRLPVKKARKK